MPIFTLTTNVPKNKVPADFLQTTSKLVASLLGKPESYVAVHITTDEQITFGGTNEPCACGSLKSIGGINPSKNKTHSAKLFDHVNKALGVAGDRMYIEFVDLPAANVGHNGGTFG